MRVCDRHPNEVARESVLIEHEYQRFDLCSECKTELLMFLCNASNRVEEPKKKNLAKAN